MDQSIVASSLAVLISEHYSVLMYPRGLRREDVIIRLLKELEIYRLVLDPTDPRDLINPEIDFIIFSRPVSISGDVVGTVLVLATWGDRDIADARFKLFKYLDDDSLEVSWEVVPTPLTAQQLLYYDHLAVAGDKEKLKMVSLFVADHEVMQRYLQDEGFVLEQHGRLSAGSLIADYSGKIHQLDQRIGDGDLVFTSQPHLVDSYLRPGARTLISGVDGREFSTSVVHLVDSWSVGQIRDVLGVIRGQEKLKLVLYVSHHPHVESLDALSYRELSEKLEKIDSLYLRGRGAEMVVLD